MNSTRPGPLNLQGLPTLTEVIEMPAYGRDAGADERIEPLAEAAVAEGLLPAAPGSALPTPAFNEERLIRRVLADLQQRADLMFEYRLREALTPVLARATETLIHELRLELAATLRDVVARAVSQELARQRGR